MYYLDTWTLRDLIMFLCSIVYRHEGLGFRVDGFGFAAQPPLPSAPPKP